MKLIALGDTHGRQFWKYIVNTQEFDILVFIGDYFDSFDIKGPEQVENFLDIIEYKKNTDKKVVMLIGNHDHHYFKSIGNTGTSGYQKVYAPMIETIIQENKEHLQMAYSHENVLFTHAGLGELWLEKRLGEYPHLQNPGDDAEKLANFINQVWEVRPDAFTFDGWDSYGDDMGQTPIWIRPRSLVKDSGLLAKKIIQVVGHTSQKQINPRGDKAGYFFIDVLETSKEYLVIEDGKFKIEEI